MRGYVDFAVGFEQLQMLGALPHHDDRLSPSFRPFRNSEGVLVGDWSGLVPGEPAMSAGELTLANYGVAELISENSEECLCNRLCRGEISAVGDAYDRYHQQVRAFARRLVGDEEATEDLVQEVFVTLPSAIRRFRGESSLKTFLLSIAVNHSRHHVRGAVRRRRAMQKLAEANAIEESTRCGQDPEVLARRKQLAFLLQRALDELPLDQRVAFVLCEVEERTSSEVASIVDAPEATVRTRLFHARKKLRSFLEQQGVAS
jgi:RNA polymerase sigma-70 factor (ECF subfamily)